jgi:hypothetical protein
MEPVYDGWREEIMKRKGVYTAILFGLMGVAAVGAQVQNQQPRVPREKQIAGITSQMPAPLKITFGDKSATWTAATLATLPHKTVTVHNEHTKADETYSGVQLIDLLTPLGVQAQPRGKDFKLYVVAVGSDDYEVVYGMGEVTPDVHDATVIVADTENGKPLADDGPLKMVATGEKRPARWVRNLIAIRVMTAE